MNLMEGSVLFDFSLGRKKCEKKISFGFFFRKRNKRGERQFLDCELASIRLLLGHNQRRLYALPVSLPISFLIRLEILVQYLR